MKLMFDKVIRREHVCSGTSREIVKPVIERCGDMAEEIIARVKGMEILKLHFDLYSEGVGDYSIEMEGGGCARYEIFRSVLHKPREIIEVSSIAEAQAICKERTSSSRVWMEPASPRRRIDAEGNEFSCGKDPRWAFSEEVIAKTIPVIGYIRSDRLTATLF